MQFTEAERALLTGVETHPDGSKYRQLKAARDNGVSSAALDKAGKKLVTRGVLRQFFDGSYVKVEAHGYDA